MGNGAKAAQKRERNGKDGKKEPQSQLRSVCSCLLVFISSFGSGCPSILRSLENRFSSYLFSSGSGSCPVRISQIGLLLDHSPTSARTDSECSYTDHHPVLFHLLCLEHVSDPSPRRSNIPSRPPLHPMQPGQIYLNPTLAYVTNPRFFRHTERRSPNDQMQNLLRDVPEHGGAQGSRGARIEPPFQEV